MAPIVCDFFSASHADFIKYSSDTLKRLNENLLPCTPLEAWVPLQCPPDQPQKQLQRDGSDSGTSAPSGRGVDNNNNRRKRGKRGGIRLRLRAMKTTVPLPSVLLANVRSFGKHVSNYTLDELHASVKYLAEYRDSCLMCFTETWWCADTQTEGTILEGFGAPYRLDRDSDVTEKSRGGGVAMYVNERWCSKKNVVVRESLCTADTELLAVSLRPTYLPREFGQLTFVVVYVHPRANNERAVTEIEECIHRLRTTTRDAPLFVLGDFNDTALNNGFHQYVNSPTRKDKTIDLCYGNIRGAYRALIKAPLGNSDHNAVVLLPTYVRKLKREPTVTKEVKVWSTEAVEQLKGCFECTDWKALTQDAVDVSEAAAVVADYIKFCEDLAIPKKVIKLFPNNKPWVTKRVKAKIIQKNKLFVERKRVEGKVIQREIDNMIKEEKLKYKDKVESQFYSGRVKDAWKGLKTLAGMGEVMNKDDGMTEQERIDFAEKLNTFYCRFDSRDFSKERENVCDSVREGLGNFAAPQIGEDTVRKVLSNVNPNKAPGPDAVGGRVLKLCSSQLAPVFCDIFNMSLETCSVPVGWKAATICPVPKKPNPSSLNDYRPIALTSVIMKCFERIVLGMLREQVKSVIDPYQFAYRRNRSVEDAVLSLLHYTHSHIENGGAYARILYVDFSSAFNTVQTHLLVQKLKEMQVSPYLTLWVADFLSDRTQAVQVRTRSSAPAQGPATPPAQTLVPSNNLCISSVQTINTGTPQGTVISPFIFTLYTDDCRSDRSDAYLCKFSDDTALVDVSDSETKYERSVELFVSWCDENFLELNVGKTKEQIVELKRNSGTEVAALSLKGQIVERVHEYRYLGTIIDDKLSFVKNTDAVKKKCRQRMYMLYQLRSLKVSSRTIELCYRAYIESILTFSFVCWYNTLTVKSKNPLSSIVNLCTKIIGKKQIPLEQLFHERALNKAIKISTDPTHPLSVLFVKLPSGRRFSSIQCKTVRFSRTFIPTVVSLLNSCGSRGASGPVRQKML